MSRRALKNSSSVKSSNHTVRGLQTYYRDLGKSYGMSVEREQDLAQRYQDTGDSEAARELVEAHLRLVVKIARDHQCETIPLADLIQEGNMGLMRAVEKFDPTRGVRLISYARWWIRAYILNYIMRNMRTVRFGTTRSQRKLFFNLNKTRRALERRGVHPSPQAIADELDVKRESVVAMMRRFDAPDASMDAPVSAGDGGSATLGAMMASEAPSPEALVSKRELWGQLRACLDRFEEKLTERDREIWTQRLLSDAPLTLRELAGQFGVSRERVRQLEARIKRRLGAFIGDRAESVAAI